MGSRRCLSSFSSCVTTFVLVLSSTIRISASQDLKEMLYAIALNGQEVSEGTIVLQKGEGDFFVEEGDLRRWRIRLPETGGVKFQNRTFYPLNKLEGIRIVVDAPTQTLRIEVPARLFVTSVLEEAETRGPKPVHGTGGFWNYDLSLEKGHGTKSRLDGIFEGGFFSRFGAVTSNFILREIGRDNSVVRLDTLWAMDDVEKRQVFRLGDSFTRGGAMGRPVRFAGFQWATNFGTDPGFISFPTPSVSGLAERASVVDVLVNNVKVLSKETPAGPFDVYKVPVTTGKGEVSLIVKDFLGREHGVIVPYYASPALLKRGLSDFSYEAGFRRENYSLGSDDYGGLLFSGSHRYGFTDSLTGEAHLEVEETTRMASIGGVWLHPSFGSFSLGIAGSHGSYGWGQQGLFGYSYVSRPFNFGITARMSSPRFDQIDLNRRLSHKYQYLMSAGAGLGRLGSLGLTFTYQRQFERERTSILTGSYNIRLWKGHLNVSGYQSFHADATYGLTATYSIPVSRERTLTAYGSAGRENHDAGVELLKSVSTFESGYGYRVRAEKSGEAERFHGSVAGQSEWGRATLDVSRLDGLNFYRGSLSGSLGVLDGKFFASRWIAQSFGIAQVAEYENVKVYRSNQEAGRTNSRGYLMIPNLLPYYSNTLRAEDSDLPFDCRIESTTVTAVPYFRSGVTVRFPIKPVRGATVTMVRPDGTFLPPGTVLRRPDVLEEWYVALKGLAYLTELPVGEVKGRAETEKGTCTFTLMVPKDLSSVPDLGTVVCKF
jgi:outer membrane usher protein